MIEIIANTTVIQSVSVIQGVVIIIYIFGKMGKTAFQKLTVMEIGLVMTSLVNLPFFGL